MTAVESASGLVRGSRSRAGPSPHLIQLDALLEGMFSGRLGGVSVSGRMPVLLVELLDALDWPIDSRAFAGAMPHFPQCFGLTELRATMAHLGYVSRERVVRGSALADLGPAVLVHERRGDWRLCVRKTSGRVVLFNPVARNARDAEHDALARRLYRVLEFMPAEDSDAPDPSRISWTGTTWRRFTPEIALLFAVSFLSSLLLILVSFAISMIFDTVVPAKASDTLVAILLGVAMVFVTDLSFRRIKAEVIGRISGRLEYVLSSSLFAKLISLPLEMLTTVPVSDQMARLRQFETVRDLFNGPFVAVVLELPFVILLIAAIAVASVKLAALILFLVIVFGALGALLVPRIKRDSAIHAQARTEHTRFLLETIAQRQQIGREGLADVWLEKLDRRSRHLAETRRRQGSGAQLLSAVSSLAMPFSAAMVIGAGAALVIAQELTGGHLIAVTILTWRLLAPLQQGMLLASRLPEIAGLLRQIDAMMKIEQKDIRASGFLQRRLEPSLTLSSMVLRYPGSVMPALAGVSAEIAPGQLVAVTGGSGAGKTTLLRAVRGLYRLQAGSVRLGGLNINQLSRSELSSHISYVSESPVLFFGTVQQNLRLAAPDATDEALYDILEEVGLGDWLRSLPEGLWSRLDPDRGDAFVTPGVKAMLTLAQALVRQPRVLLLDEPVSGLDPSHEASLMNAVAARRGEMTCLMVTHRPSFVRRADLEMRMVGGTVQLRRIAPSAPPDGAPQPSAPGPGSLQGAGA